MNDTLETPSAYIIRKGVFKEALSVKGVSHHQGVGFPGVGPAGSSIKGRNKVSAHREIKPVKQKGNIYSEAM